MEPTAAVADTSFLISLEQGRPIKGTPPARYRVSVVTVGELRAGLLAANTTAERSTRLDTLTKAMETEPLLIDDTVANAWAELRIAMRECGRRLRANDSWIAATAIAHGLPLATQDDDYEGIPGLDVINL